MASKLCPHSIQPTADARLLIEAGCPLVKFVDDFGAVDEFMAINPNLIILGRGYSDRTLLEQLYSGATPEQAAQDFVREQKARYYDRNKKIGIWEGHNEPSFGSPNETGALDRMRWYGRFEAERLRLLNDLGLRGVIANFSTGYPEINNGDIRMWDAFMPAVEAAVHFNGILGLHEYSSPWVWWLAGSYQFGNCPHNRYLPGWREDSLTDPITGQIMGWLTLRYRQIYRYAFEPRGFHYLPLVITEFGCDAVGHNCPGTPSGAWKDMVGFWGNYSGERDPIDYWRTAGDSRDAERYYAEQLIWYDREIQKDAYVLGATIFTFGTISATWEPYNVAGTRVPQYIAAHIRQTRNEPTAPPPKPPVAPPPVAPETDPAQPQPPATPATTATPTPPVTSGTAPLPISEILRQPTPVAAAPTKPRGHPREQYSRVYVLLPPNAIDPQWVEAIADSTWAKRRYTIGASADDAGIGNLHARKVLAINPEGWGTSPSLAEWMSSNYPGVVYTPLRADSPAELSRQLREIQIPAPIIPRPADPQTPLGKPNRQYSRTYVLFNPKHSDPSWVKAIARATWQRRITMGGSADDAGIGDLDNRQVIVLNPGEGYDGDIMAWFAEHYPGVKVTAVSGNSPDEVAIKVKSVIGL